MKNTVKYLFGIIVALVVCSCNITGIDDRHNDSNLVLTFSTRSLDTKALVPGEGTENNISTLNCYFYKKGETEVGAKHTLFVPSDGLKVAADGTVTFTTTLANNIVDELGLKTDVANQCEVYVVANAQSNITSAADSKVSTLKQLFLSSDFAASVPSDFVMDGSSVITYSTATKSMSGNVSLCRSAVKLALQIINIENKVTDSNGNEWEPKKDNVKVELVNGVKKSVIDSELYPYSPKEEDEDYYSCDQSASINAEAVFYSYSSDWGKKDNPDKEAYYIVRVPWKKVGETEYRTYSYQVPVNNTTKKLVRNHYYLTKLSIGVLGSLDSEPVTLEPLSCMIAPWGNMPTDNNIQDYQYLVVEQNSVVINNAASHTMTYISSDPVKVTVKSITYDNYAQATTRHIVIDESSKKYYTGDPTKLTKFTDAKDNNKHSDYSVTATAHTSKPATLTFTHAIPTNYAPHTVTVEVTNGKFTEVITYKQYPPIYFEAEKSNGKVFVNNNAYTGNVNHVDDYDYDQFYSDVEDYYIGSISNPDIINGSGDNNNQNQYNIYISAFSSAESQYVICDPRDNNASGITGFTSPKLDEYRAARTGTGDAYLIAPKFKNASSYGKTTPLTYKNAQRRCATYQENGYPAGRWRIPTLGEVDFIVRRSAEGDIPSLFDGSYWVSNGKYYNSDNKAAYEPSKNGQYAVRCVYDIWYWGEKNEKDALETAMWSYQFEN